MNHPQHQSEASISTPTTLQKIRSTVDLRNLGRRRGRRGRRSKSKRESVVSNISAKYAENRLSENSQVLYMATSGGDKRRSQISSAPADIDEGKPEATSIEMKTAEDTKAEALAWGMIEQEICEWQYICKSGRPYCWSRESRRKQSYSQPVFPDFSDNSFWSGDGSEDNAHVRNEAFSESFSKDTANLDATAEMVALQLLGSCYTLPNYHAQMASKHRRPAAHSESLVQDPRLISSLKLHSQFRYSPSFGHQAPNPSPVQFGPGIYDGTPSPPSEDLETDPSEYSIHEFGETSRRKGRNSRALNNSEASESSFSVRSGHYTPRRNTIDRDVNAVTKAWYRRNSIREAVSRSLTLPGLKAGRARADRLEGSLDDEPPRSTRTGRVLTKQHPPSSGFRLQSVLRSEPHPVYVQPVKELVVKRWRKIRRKLSTGHHSHSAPGSQCGHISEASESGRSTMSDDGKLRRRRAQETGDIHSSLDNSPRSTTPASGCSPAFEEGRLSGTRQEEYVGERTRTRRGTNTVCGSDEGSAHHNTPCSLYSTPDGVQRTSWLTSGEGGSVQELNDTLASEAAAALIIDNNATHARVHARVHTEAATASTPLQPPSTPVANHTSGSPGTPGGTRAPPPTSSSPKTLSGGKAPNNKEFQLRTMQLIPAFQPSSMKIPKDRRRRKSCLSEVYTPDEFHKVTSGSADAEESSALRTVESALDTSMEKSLTPTYLSNYPTNDIVKETFGTSMERSQPPTHPGNGPADDATVGPSMVQGQPPIYLSNDPTDPIPNETIGNDNASTVPHAAPRRPNLFRMSSSGTQVFTPGSDGVEVDGLPVGPSNDMWSGLGERKERSYL
jgi:hypothetical protein